jgi:hypothetical protein
VPGKHVDAAAQTASERIQKLKKLFVGEFTVEAPPLATSDGLGDRPLAGGAVELGGILVHALVAALAGH